MVLVLVNVHLLFASIFIHIHKIFQFKIDIIYLLPLSIYLRFNYLGTKSERTRLCIRIFMSHQRAPLSYKEVSEFSLAVFVEATEPYVAYIL